MNIRHCNILGRFPSLARPLRRDRRRVAHSAGGFTLIELMVVLAIMAVVTALTVGTFRSLTDNNQRTGCQANLQQVYQGLRLYMADEGAQAPLFDPKAPARSQGIGLWNLWTFPDTADFDKLAPVGSAPVGRYLRSTHVLHCPSDSEPGSDPMLRPNPAELYTNASKAAYNSDFLSYQMYALDTRNGENVYSSSDRRDDPAYGQEPTLYTYLPTRTQTVGATDAEKLKFKRQLRQPIPSSTNTPKDAFKRPPLDSTVVTWCRHHRYTRDYDNVVFFDGSVQLIPRVQDNYDQNCVSTGSLTGSERVPRRVDCGQ